MSMTRKHYKEVAAAISETFDRAADYKYSPEKALGYLADKLADIFQEDNALFDRTTFLDAAGFSKSDRPFQK